MSKEVVAIQVDGGCMESYPCQHNITLTFKDGRKEKKHSDGRTIAQEWFALLNDKNKEHFKEYLQSEENDTK